MVPRSIISTLGGTLAPPSRTAPAACCRALPRDDDDLLGSDLEAEVVGGNRGIQEALADILHLEVAKQQAKEEILEDLAQRKETLLAIGEEVGGGAGGVPGLWGRLWTTGAE